MGWGISCCWGNAGLAEKASRDTGYRSDSIAISRDAGPLSAIFKRGDLNPGERHSRDTRDDGTVVAQILVLL